jgi:hypothetical protein
MLVDSYRFAASGPSGPPFTDDFNRTDSASTMGNLDTGQTWVPNSGTWGIASNKAYEAGAAPSQTTTVFESGVSDCSVEVTFSTFDDSGLCFRSSDDSNNIITNATNVFKRVAGGFTSLAVMSTFGTGDVMKITGSGSGITVDLNGSGVAGFSESFNNTATKHGLRQNATTNGRFDDFSVTVP